MRLDIANEKLSCRVLAVFLAAFAYMTISCFIFDFRAQAAAETVEAEENVEQLHRLAEDIGNIFRHAAETVSPAVVWIEAERRVELQPRRHPFEEFFGPEFEQFFGPQRQQEREFRHSGLGSGMIIDDDGHILTNNHVVAGAEVISIKLPDGREFDAQIAGADEHTELAVIRIKGDFQNLPVVEFGDSDQIHVGEWVVAIGNPLGLDWTVSAGVVSAKGRSVGLARLLI